MLVILFDSTAFTQLALCDESDVVSGVGEVVAIRVFSRNAQGKTFLRKTARPRANTTTTTAIMIAAIIPP